MRSIVKIIPHRYSKSGEALLHQSVSEAKALQNLDEQHKTLDTYVMGLGTQDGPTVYVLRSLLPGNLRNFARSGPLDLNHSFAMVVAALVTLSGGKLAEGANLLQEYSSRNHSRLCLKEYFWGWVASTA